MRILVITGNRLGDTVLQCGLINHFRSKYPHADFTIVTGELPAGLFAAFPEPKRITIIKKKKYHLHWFEIWAELFYHYWDIIIDFRLSGLGFSLLHKQLIRPKKYKINRHKVETTADSCGLNVEDVSPVVWFSKADQEKAQAILNQCQDQGREWGQNKQFVLMAPILMAPIANFPGKSWPMERFIQLAETLCQKGGVLDGHPIILLAADYERDQLQYFCDHYSLPVYNLAGDLSLGEISALMTGSRIFIGNDSGLMHQAAAANCPTLGLFGPSNEQEYGPFGSYTMSIRTPEGHQELWDSPARFEGECLMTSLTSDDVFEKAQMLLDQTAHKCHDNIGQG